MKTCSKRRFSTLTAPPRLAAAVGRGSHSWFRTVQVLVLLAAAFGSGWSALAQANCSACWSAVTNWHGTWSLTLVGAGLNDSSEGTFDIHNGVPTVQGTGSMSGTAPECSLTGSGALDASSYVNILIDTTNCTYTVMLSDRLQTVEIVGGMITLNTVQSPSGDVVNPAGLIPEAIMPYFPLPAFGQPLVESGTFTAPFPGIPCYSFAGATLTISWTIEPVFDSSTPPRFTQLPTGGPLGCNPTDTPDDSTVLDNSQATAASGMVSVESSHVDVTNGCTVTRSFTLTATDDCSQAQAHALVVYWWTNDTTSPVITRVPSGSNLGCNPTNPPTDAAVQGQVVAFDDCGPPTLNVSHVDTTNDCAVTRTFTITAADECGNVTPAETVVFTWTTDTTPPTFTHLPTGGDLGANPASLPDDTGIAAQVTASDNCDPPTLNVSHADTTNDCTGTRTFTITATDPCGNQAKATVRYTWTVGVPGPILLCGQTNLVVVPVEFVVRIFSCGHTVTLAWNATSGHTYTVGTSPDLANWTVVGTVIATQNGLVSWTTNMAASRAYFRVVQ